MFCPECGKQIAEYSTFCIHCGKHFDRPSPSESGDGTNAGGTAASQGAGANHGYGYGYSAPQYGAQTYGATVDPRSASLYYNIKPKGPIESIGNFFRNYAVFTGRSTRSEFFWALLFRFIISLVISIIEVSYLIPELLKNPALLNNLSETNTELIMQLVPMPLQHINTIVTLVLFIPSLALLVRRLHDIGRSGFWAILGLIPIVNLVIVVFVFLDSTVDNEYGLRKIDINSPKMRDVPPLYYNPKYYEYEANAKYYGRSMRENYPK